MDIETANYINAAEQRVLKKISDLDERLINFIGVQQVSDSRSADALEKIVELIETRPITQPVKIESVGFPIDKRMIFLGMVIFGLIILVASLGGEGLRIFLANSYKVPS